jgi:hypothetical protein
LVHPIHAGDSGVSSRKRPNLKLCELLVSGVGSPLHARGAGDLTPGSSLVSDVSPFSQE